MKNLFLTLLISALSTCFSIGQTWQQVGGTIQSTNGFPVLKNLANGAPVVAFVNTAADLSLAIFDIPNQSWNIIPFPSISNATNVSLDIVDDMIFIGCTSDNASYGIYLYDLVSSSFATVTTSTPFFFNNNITFSVGSYSPLRIALAYERNLDGHLACLELVGANNWNSVGGNALDINNSNALDGKIKLSTDNNFIHIVANFDEDMELPLRIFRKPFDSPADFTEPANSPLELDGSPFFDIANSKIDQGAQPFYNYAATNQGVLRNIRTKRHDAVAHSLMTNPLFNTFDVITDLASVGNEDVNYVFFNRTNISPSASNFVVRSQGGNFSPVGSSIGIGAITGLDIGMNYTTEKPYVGYFQSGVYRVETFNRSPNFEDIGFPTDLCENSGDEVILDFLQFLDDDGDELFVTNVTSSNQSVISSSNLNVNKLSYNPNGGSNIFEVEATPNTGASGTTTITVTVTDGIQIASRQFNITVHPIYNETAAVSICAGSSYQFGTQTLTAAGTYTETFPSVEGCDSIVELTLTLVAPEFILPSAEVCSNVNPINLVNFATQTGGLFSGVGVFNNKFFPSQVTPNNTYTLTYTRFFPSIGCTAIATQEITVNATPIINVVTTQATCAQNDGEATATFTSAGSGGLHNVYWSFGTSELGVASSAVSDLAPGLYFVNATNEFGCSASAPVNISSSSVQISGTVSPVSCFGSNDGEINVTINSSAGVSSINWSNGATTEDITNLTAGPYEITVIDDNGCQASETFTIGSPGEILWTTNITPSSCGNNDGSVTVTPLGGTAPYSYQWFDGQGNPLGSTTNTLSGLVAGNYLSTISDVNGCTKVASVMISDAGSPTIELNTLTTASCDNDGAIDIDIITSSTIQSITWSNGETTEDLTDLSAGSYSVYVLDGNGCAGMLSVELEPTLPVVQPICLVTVDTSTITNKIVWEREQLTGIAFYNIYRETSQANAFQLVYSQPYAEESEWTDSIASPMIRSWRYMISATDSCGVESELSPVHKTIHLSINAGIGSDVNLAWDSYEGFPYSQFVIWRYTDATGWIDLTDLPSNLFSFTDVGVLGIPGLDYFIEVVPAASCTSEKAQDYNSSRSNKARGEFNPAGVGNVGLNQLKIEAMTVYPNPAQDELTINLFVNTTNTLSAVLLDATGKQIQTMRIKNGLNVIDINQLENGMYFIQLSENGANKTVKFIKN